jgi:hypothetical protein
MAIVPDDATILVDVLVDGSNLMWRSLHGGRPLNRPSDDASASMEDRMLETSLERIARVVGRDTVDREVSKYGKSCPDEEMVSYDTILELSGLNFALMAMRAEPAYDNYWRTFAVWCANQVIHLANDDRSVAAIRAAGSYLAMEPYGSYEKLDYARWQASMVRYEILEAAAPGLPLPREQEVRYEAAGAAMNTAAIDAAVGAYFASRCAAIASPRGFIAERKAQAAEFLEIVGRA